MNTQKDFRMAAPGSTSQTIAFSFRTGESLASEAVARFALFLGGAAAKSLFAWTVVAALGPCLLAQRYTFRQYDSSDGLTNMTVYCVLQDRTGYIWAGTDNGLFRYDGRRFQAYQGEDGLPSSTVRAMAESPDGAVWVATRAGIARQAGNRFQTVPTGVNGVVRELAFDSHGRIYVEGPTGILRGEPDGGGSYRFAMLEAGKVSGLMVHGEDVWFGRDGDLWHRNGDGAEGKAAERVGSPAGLPADRWTETVEDSAGNLWTQSETRLYELPRGESRFVDRSTGLPKTMSGLDADGHGRVFVSSESGTTILEGAGEGAGKGARAGERRTMLDSRHGLPAEQVRKAMVDREGSLWLGTEGGGLIRQLGRGEWLGWTKEEGLLSNTIWGVVLDRAGQAWVGSNGGLNLIGADGTMSGSWTGRNGLGADEVESLAMGRAGDIYAATYPWGISRFLESGKLAKTYRSASVRTAGWILSMAVDREGRVWTVGRAGCFRSRERPGSGEPGDDELVMDRVEIPGMGADTSYYAVMADEDVWIGSSRGLARYANGQWQVYTEHDGLKPSGVGVIGHGQGAVWVGYEDAHGLTRLEWKDGRVSATDFTTENGLSSNKIYALAFDARGRLWASSDAGVNVFDQGRWQQYSRENGLIWNDGDSFALATGADGSVWVGTSSGLARYKPVGYELPEEAPPVVVSSITGGTMGGNMGGNMDATRQWTANERPALPYARRSLRIDYAALSYIAESRMRFRYRLLGYDTEWTETRERSVSFEGLPAGHYVFQVIAVGANGLMSKPAEFSFSITPPWWQTWWFVTLSLVAVMGLASALWRLRVRSLMAQKAHLEEQVEARTAELLESHRQLEEIAFRDMLTSLPNRRGFSQSFRTRLETALRNRERFALMLIDLDGFKQINDTFGHDAGDAVLVEIANRLRAEVRENDCVARMGGDEFAILLCSTYDPKDLEEFCTRIVERIRVGIGYNAGQLTVGSSVGVAVFPEDGRDEKSLYKAADLSLYTTKRTRPHYVVRTTAEMSEKLLR